LLVLLIPVIFVYLMSLQVYCVWDPEGYVCELPSEFFYYDPVEQFCNHVKCTDLALPYIIEEVQTDLEGLHEWSRDLLEVSGVITPGTFLLVDELAGLFNERDPVLTFMSLEAEQPHLSERQREQLGEVIDQFPTLFSQGKSDLGESR
jgi:hypothetical protein